MLSSNCQLHFSTSRVFRQKLFLFFLFFIFCAFVFIYSFSFFFFLFLQLILCFQFLLDNFHLFPFSLSLHFTCESQYFYHFTINNTFTRTHTHICVCMSACMSLCFPIKQITLQVITSYGVTWQQKAYDIVQQSCIVACLKMQKISNEIIKFIENTIENWRVELTTWGKCLAVVKTNRSIFQEKKAATEANIRVFNTKIFWFGLVLWHINLCRLFNVKSIFM